MTAEPHTEVLDLVEWVAQRQRPYAEVMAEWHSARGQASPLVEAVGQSIRGLAELLARQRRVANRPSDQNRE